MEKIGLKIEGSLVNSQSQKAGFKYTLSQEDFIIKIKEERVNKKDWLISFLYFICNQK